LFNFIISSPPRTNAKPPIENFLATVLYLMLAVTVFLYQMDLYRLNFGQVSLKMKKEGDKSFWKGDITKKH